MSNRNESAGRSAMATFAGEDTALSFKCQINDAGTAIAARYRSAGFSPQDAADQAAAFARRFVRVGDHDPELDATLSRVAATMAEPQP